MSGGHPFDAGRAEPLVGPAAPSGAYLDVRAVHVTCPVHGTWIYPHTAVSAVEAFEMDHAGCELPPRPVPHRGTRPKSRRSAL